MTIVLLAGSEASLGQDSGAERRQIETQVAEKLAEATAESKADAFRIATEFWAESSASLDRFRLVQRAIRELGSDAAPEWPSSIDDPGRWRRLARSVGSEVFPRLPSETKPESDRDVYARIYFKRLAAAAIEAEHHTAALGFLNWGDYRDTEQQMLIAWAKSLQDPLEELAGAQELVRAEPQSLLAHQVWAAIALRAKRPVKANEPLRRARYLSPRNHWVSALRAEQVRQTEGSETAKKALAGHLNPDEASGPGGRALNAKFLELELDLNRNPEVRSWIGTAADSALTTGWRHWLLAQSYWNERTEGTTLEELRSVVNSWHQEGSWDLVAQRMLTDCWVAFLEEDLERLETLAKELPPEAPERADRWVEQLRQKVERDTGSQRFHTVLILSLGALLGSLGGWWWRRRRSPGPA